jgi:cytochrome P450
MDNLPCGLMPAAAMNSADPFSQVGLGSRTCIGRHISMLEISKLIPRLVQDFDFELSGDLARPGISWTTNNYWFVKPKDFCVEVKLRQR